VVLLALTVMKKRRGPTGLVPPMLIRAALLRAGTKAQPLT